LLNLATPKLIRLAKTYLMGTALSTSLSVGGSTQTPTWNRDSILWCFRSMARRSRFTSGSAATATWSWFLAISANWWTLKRRLGKRTPVLSWNFLAFEHNAHEIPSAARMARELGVNQFRGVNPFDVRWDDPEIRPAAVKASVRRLDSLSMGSQPENWNPFPESVDTGTIARAFENPWNQQAATDSPPSSGHTCHWLYKNMMMDATGRIMPCCGGPRPDIKLAGVY